MGKKRKKGRQSPHYTTCRPPLLAFKLEVIKGLRSVRMLSVDGDDGESGEGGGDG